VDRYVRFGASPRGAQSLVLAAKAAALLDGRPNVAAADIRAMAAPALRHRLVLGYEATADGVSADDVVAAVLESVPEPAAGLRGAPE
jgi:MoxR-like ATPase